MDSNINALIPIEKFQKDIKTKNRQFQSSETADSFIFYLIILPLVML
jgi:hypothetical protein